MKNPFLILVLSISLFFTHYSYGAVTSQGEINVAGQTKGIVPASSTVPLIVTLQIDRSLAEIGEEIKTIEIIMPTGFVPQVSDFDSILRDKETLKAKAIISGNALRIELAQTIVDTQNSRYDIAFDCRTSNNFFEAVFRVLLRNNDDVPIGEFIKEGQADGKLNNDDFTLQVIPNVPPAPVSGFTAESDKTGENDVTLRWQKSTDPDVNGYLIYRDKDFQINVENRASTTFRDVDVLPGNHTYEITAYKTLFLQSERSPIQTVEVSEDTAAPEPPNMLRVVTSSEGIEVSWKPSVSRDTTRYQILFGSSEVETLEPLPDGEISTDDAAHESFEFKFVDRRPLSVGSFIYAVVAIDEANNESVPAKERFRIFDKPYPNPFTPLSDDSDFNTLIFPARAVEDVEGEFSVLLFNLNGVLVKTLTAQLGETELKWNGKNESGEIVESGIYIYQLQVGNSIKTGTIIVVK
ncbi:MAG: T9SS type A sorting domain-containing protein [Candidatus Poribacteria bacterium]|nr:T9SS type A sorting domain-containing protein [Candidatus Poribacteria bacterium]